MKSQIFGFPGITEKRTFKKWCFFVVDVASPKSENAKYLRVFWLGVLHFTFGRIISEHSSRDRIKHLHLSFFDEDQNKMARCAWNHYTHVMFLYALAQQYLSIR